MRSRPYQSDAPQGGFEPFWVQLKDGQTLDPGGNCLVHPLKADGTAITAKEFTVYDPHYRTFAYSVLSPVHREKILVAWNRVTKRFETHGEQRLRRKGKTDAGVTADASGTISLWHTADSTVNVTAWLDWCDGGEDIPSASTEVLIEYFPDEQRWRIVAVTCS